MSRSSPYKYIEGIPRHFSIRLCSARDLLSMSALLSMAAIATFVPESGLSVDHQTQTFTADTHRIYASSDATISAALSLMQIL